MTELSKEDEAKGYACSMFMEEVDLFHRHNSWRFETMIQNHEGRVRLALRKQARKRGGKHD